MTPLDDLHAREEAARGIEPLPIEQESTMHEDPIGAFRGFMLAAPLALIFWGCALATWDWFD